MSRQVTIFTGQWADLPLEKMCQKAKSFGYDGVELACWGDHLNYYNELKASISGQPANVHDMTYSIYRLKLYS